MIEQTATVKADHFFASSQIPTSNVFLVAPTAKYQYLMGNFSESLCFHVAFTGGCQGSAEKANCFTSKAECSLQQREVDSFFKVSRREDIY